jgi:hypothetical protein
MKVQKVAHFKHMDDCTSAFPYYIRFIHHESQHMIRATAILYQVALVIMMIEID